MLTPYLEKINIIYFHLKDINVQITQKITLSMVVETITNI